MIVRDTPGPGAAARDRRADPHAGGRVARGGAPLHRARLAVVMAHGRGGSPEDMLGLAEHLALPDLAFLALEAAGRSWWPESFLAPLAANEPGLSSALAAVERVMADLLGEGLGPERVAVLGFSQGACLVLEHAARAGRPYRAVAALSGALVGTAEAGGPPRADLHGHAPKRLDYPKRLDGVPVLLGSHERDPHIPLPRVRESAAALEAMGAEVTTQIHPGVGHGVVAGELAWLRGLLNLPRGAAA